MKKKTKIICTMGPNTDDEELLEKLILEGMDVARFNFSHGTYEEQKHRMDSLKKIRKKLGIPVAIMLDTKGPEIRTCLLENHKSVEILDGSTFTFTTRNILGNDKIVQITYENLPNELKVDDTILIDDGLLKFKVKEISGSEIICTTINGGTLSERKGVNLPGVNINLPAITQKDKEDLLFGIENDIDYVAASFIRSAEAVNMIRDFLKENGGENIHIISKIENAEGVNNMDAIIKASDGIMVARGDMGVEIPIEQVPHIQKIIITKCRSLFKPVITATQMLDSMIRNPSPTRAEVTDVANAILDCTDAIMLSGETAVGKYPIEAVRMMCKIALDTECFIDYDKSDASIYEIESDDVSKYVCYSSVLTAESLNAKYIVTPSISGFTSRIISKYHPKTPVIGMSPNESALRKMQLYWGIYPVSSIRMSSDSDLIERSINILKNNNYVEANDRIVITAGITPVDENQEVSGLTNTMRVSLIN